MGISFNFCFSCHHKQSRKKLHEAIFSNISEIATPSNWRWNCSLTGLSFQFVPFLFGSDRPHHEGTFSYKLLFTVRAVLPVSETVEHSRLRWVVSLTRGYIAVQVKALSRHTNELLYNEAKTKGLVVCRLKVNVSLPLTALSLKRTSVRIFISRVKVVFPAARISDRWIIG